MGKKPVRAVMFERIKADPPTTGWEERPDLTTRFMDWEPEKAGWAVMVRVFKYKGKTTGKKMTLGVYGLRDPDGEMLKTAKGVIYVADEPEKATTYLHKLLKKRPKETRDAHLQGLVDFLKAHCDNAKAQQRSVELSAREIAREVHRKEAEVGRDLASLAKAGKIKSVVRKEWDTADLYSTRAFGGAVSMKRNRVYYWVESKERVTMEYLHEYRRMTGIGPSLMEKAAADPMLDVLAKAFSVKDVTPADVKFIRYRKVGKGIELEDQAERLGGILTSVEPSDADPKALVAFLKKHGAKGMKAESLDEQVYSVLGPGPKASAESDVAKFCADIERGVQSAVRGKFFRCRPNLKFGVGGANIDYANIPATEQPGGLAFLNAKVQVRLTVDGFDAEGNLKGSKIKVEKLTSPHGVKFRAKTGTVDQVVKHIVSTIKAAAAL
jgi:hypothetical protein